MRKFSLFIIQFALIVTCANAQGWQRFYGDAGAQRSFNAQMLPDGSGLLIGSQQDTLTGASTDMLLYHVDAWGQVLSSQTHGSEQWNEYGNVLYKKPDGTWLLAGGASPVDNPTGLEGQMAIFNPDGSTTLLPDTLVYPVGGKDLGNGFALYGGQYMELSPDNWYPVPYLTRLDTNGQTLWSWTLPFGVYGEMTGVVPTSDGGMIGAGWFFPGLQGNSFLIRTDVQGNWVDTAFISFASNIWGRDLLKKDNGELVLVSKALGVIAENIVALHCYNEGFNELWSRSYAVPGIIEVNDAAILPDGRIAIVGTIQADVDEDRDAFLMMHDSDGNFLWRKTYGGLKGDIFWDVKANQAGGVLMTGQTASFGDGSLQSWLVQTDSLGTIWSHEISGQVLVDENMNCSPDALDSALDSWLVVAAGTEGNIYGLTDDQGQYVLQVDTGNWYVSVLPPNTYYSACTDSVLWTVLDSMPDPVQDFMVQEVYNCPLMFVDVSTPYLRRCFDNNFQLEYRNMGPAETDDVRIEVILDPYLSISTASAPFVQSGDTLWFDIGFVPSQTAGAIQFTAYLDCDSTVLGQNHCIEAHIVPDSICTEIDPGWDMSSLSVSGSCVGDSVILIISNTGIGDMLEPVEFVITEDIIIFRRDPIQLMAGEDTTIVVYPNGATIVLQVNQPIGHPGSDFTSLVVEGCGGFPFSTGFAQMFPLGDGDPFSDIECKANIGSYDPNDKTAFPTGAGPDHWIRPDAEIEYLIRFQNTGTDTAFRVEIRDTLSPYLDLSTLQLRASSHPMQMNVLGAGTLQFVFDPIALPDSNVNQEASSGFVSFSIKNKPGIAPGQLIENSAAIYFDFNPAIITTTVQHRIVNPLDTLSLNADNGLSQFEPNLFRASPNPYHQTTQLAWEPEPGAKRYSIELFDVLGRVRGRFYSSAAQFQLDGTTLDGNLFYVRISTEGKHLTGGWIQQY